MAVKRASVTPSRGLPATEKVQSLTLRSPSSTCNTAAPSDGASGHLKRHVDILQRQVAVSDIEEHQRAFSFGRLSRRSERRRSSSVRCTSQTSSG